MKKRVFILCGLLSLFSVFPIFLTSLSSNESLAVPKTAKTNDYSYPLYVHSDYGTVLMDAMTPNNTPFDVISLWCNNYGPGLSDPTKYNLWYYPKGGFNNGILTEIPDSWTTGLPMYSYMIYSYEHVWIKKNPRRPN